jgi:hypothetical protein
MLVYLAATALMGRQVLFALNSTIANDSGDPVLNAAILAWNAQTIPWTEAWYQFPAFFPTRDVLTFSEHLLGVSILSTPLYWLTGDAIAAYNLTLLLSFPLCGMAMYAFVFRLTRSAPAAFLGGLAFAFAPYRIAHLAHIQVLTVYWMPLALLGLHAFIQTGKKRWLALYGFSWALQGAANGYFLVYFTVCVGLWLLWFVVAHRQWRKLAMIAATTVGAALPLTPILLRYVRVHDYQGFSRNINEIALYGADIAGPLCATSSLTFWGWLRVACGGPESELFPGAALLVLCAIGLVAGHRRVPEAPPISDPRRLQVIRRLVLFAGIAYLLIAISVMVVGPFRLDAGFLRVSSSSSLKPFSTATALLVISVLLSPSFRRAARDSATATFYSGVSLIAWTLSWGPIPRLSDLQVFYRPPYAWLMELPGVDGLRVPARFWMVALTGLVIVMGILVARLLAGRSRRAVAAIVGAAAVALLADGWTTIQAAAVPEKLAAPERLRGETVLVLPVGDLYVDVKATFSAVTEGWKSVNGYSGFAPAYYEAIRAEMSEENSTLFGLLRASDDLHVIVPADEPVFRRMVEAQPHAELVAHENGHLQYKLPRQGGLVSAASLAAGAKLEPRSIAASCSPQSAAYALDADLTTRWNCGPQREEREISVDLGAIVRVGAIVHALGEFAGEFPRQLVVETSRDGSTWEEAWMGNMLGAVLPAAVDDPDAMPATVAFVPRAARFVRLRQPARERPFDWSITELEIWSDSAPPAIR